MDPDKAGNGPNPDESRPGLITCPQCGHPNLEFRGHCRRCGGALRGAASLIPGVDLIEWTPTDGATRGVAKRVPPRVLAMLAGLLVVIGAALALPAYALIIIVIVLLVALKLSAFRSLGRRDLTSADGARENQGAPPGTGEFDGPTGQCPECSATILEVDDVCPACGAIVGIDSESTRDTEEKG